MPAWLFHGWAEDAVAAAKAAGMYAVALIGLRLSPRRTLSQWTAIDVAAAVALGAIIGRTAIAQDQSLAVGAAALLAILAAHFLLDGVPDASPRRRPRRPPREDPRRPRPTVPQAAAAQRADRGRGARPPAPHGVDSLSDVRYVLYESKGELTIVPERGPQVPDPDLVRIALHETAA